jgi:alkylation response protein AidB-like acyl-CoA dehydrogenase
LVPRLLADPACEDPDTGAAIAVWADSTPPIRRPAAVAAAKVQLAETGRHVTQLAIQLHGGVGITDEHDGGRWFKRMLASNASFGDAEHHLARFAARAELVAGV